MTIGPRVLVIGPFGRPFVCDWARAASGAAIVVGLDTGRAMGPDQVGDEIPVHRADVQPGSLLRLPGLSGLGERARARALCRHHDMLRERYGPFDIVHSHFFSSCVGVGALARRRGLRWVHTEHSSAILDGTVSTAGLRTLTDVATSADALLAVGDELAAALGALGASDVVVCDNPVYFTPPPGLTREDLTVSVGGAIERKRHVAVLDAFVSATTSPSRLTILGDGPERAVVLDAASRAGRGDDVELPGDVSREHVADALGRARLYVHAARTETFGVALVEARLAGLPVVATDCGGVVRRLDGPGVRVVADPADLAEAMRAAVAEESDHAEIASVARTQFAPERVVQTLADVYRPAP